MSTRTLAGLSLAAALVTTPLLAQPATLDPALGQYARVAGVAGNLNSVGSDTLNNLMTLWAEDFRRQYPNLRIQIEGKGSSTAPPALIAGTAQLGPMSREMKAEEIDAFEKRFGYKPTAIRVALDALAVYVNKDNPISQLTLAEVDGMFSKTRRCGGKDVANWGAAGAQGAWAAKPISLYGRNSASGTYGYFKEKALCKGDYRETVKEQPGSASVVQGVTEDLNGIGYSGIGYRTSGVKPLKLAAKKDGVYFGVEPQDVYSGNYPLARYLYVYLNQPPNRPLDPLVREFLKFVLTANGQQDTVKDGYLPLTAKVAATELAKIQ